MAAGAHAYRGTIEQSQNKRNARKRQHDIRSEDTSWRHLWLIDDDERTSTNTLALGYPLIGPSGHVRAYYCMPQSNPGFSAAIHFTMKRSAPCSAALYHLPSSWAAIVHSSASSEVVRPGNTRSSLFPGPPRSPRHPPILRRSRTSAVSYSPCAPQTP